MAARKTVHDIFKSMEYEPPNSSTATAKFWMDQHSCSFGFFINGEFVCPSDRKTNIMTDAAGLLLCSTLSAADEDISRSASSSLNGFKLWSALPCYQRANVLQRLSSGLQGQSQCLTELCEMVRSPCSTSALVRLVQYYTGWAQLRDILFPGWTPLGTVAVVGSDECSLYALWLKVLPALALGNAVIIKPGAETALPSLLMASLFGKAGLPAGVLNIITGEGVGVKVAQNPLISHVTYSGNRKDGTLLSRDAAGWGAPVSLTLSLSAVCPFIIFESADVDSAVDGVIEAAFKKKREWKWVLYVQESVWDDVVKRLKIRIAAMKCLPLLAESDNSVVDAAVNAAKQQGATVIQPCPPPSSLAQYPPTVLCGVAPSCPCVVSPPPGPVLSALSFRTVGEGITLGNHSPHGQAASIWTEDLTLALESAKSLSVGTVWINSHSVLDPSLSVSGRKESGNCTDGGQEGLFQFLRPFVSSPLHPSSPCSVDYIKFGSTASQLPIPEGSKRADFVPRSYLQFVGGQQCKSDSGSSIPVLSPSGSVLAYCPDGGRKDIRNAVEGAIKIQPGWMKKSPVSRSQSLYSLAECLELRKSDLAQSLHSQTGLSLEDAQREVELSISRLCDWAAFCDKKGGEVQSLPQSGSVLSIPEPIGVVGVVLPDRRPLLSLVSLLGAAVAVGSAVVMVPSEKYPLPALEFIQVLQSSTIPGGLVSIITGCRDQLTQALANHSVIQAIWYWGSQEGCQYLHYTCSDPLKRLWLHFEEREEKEGGVRGARDWALSPPSLLEEVWMQAVQWKSVWIPTA